MLDDLARLFADQTWVKPVVIGIVAIVAIVVLREILMALWRAWMRWRAGRDLGCLIRPGFKVRHSTRYREVGSFLLAYPTWAYPKQDGTQDRRRSGNYVIKHWSVLEVRGWRILCRDVYAMYDLVNIVRDQGIPVAESAHEQAKRARLSSHVRQYRAAVSQDSLVAEFSDHASDFETFCAEVFRRLGYWAETTPASRDGGFDIRLEKDGVRYLVECKCYARSHSVGRPIIQKLVGANAVEHADRLKVVTTSSFSPDAIDFAGDLGVELIDGARVVALCRQVGMSMADPAFVPAMSVRLTDDEIRTGFPADLRR